MTDKLPTALTDLTQSTVSAFQSAKSDKANLEKAMLQFLEKAQALHLSTEQIENLLGVNEQSIMDLAQLDEDDEEVLIDFFEDWAEKNL